MIQDISINIGSSGSSNSDQMPYKSYYYKNKVQFVLTKTELELFGIKKGQLIHALHLKSTGQPSRNLTNFRIRIGQTNNDVLTTWEKTNLSLVFEGTVPRVDLVANTTKKYDFISPYIIGDGNLLIEISRDETTGSSSGAMGTRTGLASGKMIGWRADSGASFPFDNVAVTSFNFILDVSLSIEKKNYKLSGTYITTTIPRSEPLRIAWLEDKPIGTNILVEYKEQDGEWFIAENSQTIVGNTDINIRVTLSTDSNDKTPTLKSIWLENPTTPQDKILLTMDWWGKFNNVEGDLTVAYNATKGNLLGQGGAVDSFEVSFNPIDLIQTPNPNAEEFILAYPYEILLELKNIEYINAYAKDDTNLIKAYPYEIVLDLKDVSEINP